MNDQLKSILNRIPFKLLLLVLAGWYGYLFYQFEYSTDSERVQKEQELEGVRANLARTKKRLGEIEKFKLEVAAKTAEVRALYAKLSEMKLSISDRFDDVEFLRAINAEAGRTGLAIERLNAEGLPQKRENYVEQGFQIGFRGVFVQVLVFFHRVTQMKSIASIESFTLTSPNSQASGFVRLDGVMKINGYSYNESKVDELAKGGEGAKK